MRVCGHLVVATTAPSLTSVRIDAYREQIHTIIGTSLMCVMLLVPERVDDGRFSRTVIAFPPPDEDESRMHLKQRDGLDFHFNDVFDPSVSQEQVFNEVCLVSGTFCGFVLSPQRLIACS